MPPLGPASERHMGEASKTPGKNPKGAGLSEDGLLKRLALIQNTLTHPKPNDWKSESFSLSC